MTRRRWIADECTEDRAWLLGANAAHLGRVLRARVGQEFDLVCGGRLRRATIVSVNAERVEFALGDALEGTGERELVLLMAIYKFDRLEWAIEKCTELGVSRILPVIARRTDAHLAAAVGKRVERWRRIAHEAAQQSRRLAPPRIDEAVKLKPALDVLSALPDSITQAPARLLLNEHEQSETFRDALMETAATGASGALAFAVGPEGGWTEDEVAEFGKAGWRSVSFGSTILRAETAAIAALAAARAILG